MNRAVKNMTVFVLLVLMVVYSYSLLLPEVKQIQQLDYSGFMEQVNAGNVKTAAIVADSSGGVYTVSGELGDNSLYVVTVPPDPQLAGQLETQNDAVQYDVEPPPPWWVTMLST
mgnify:CR=1 FL=1